MRARCNPVACVAVSEAEASATRVSRGLSPLLILVATPMHDDQFDG
jgi:hypothetical protein